jgi:hypothetical protein
MFHACVERFDVIGGSVNILGWDGEVNTAIAESLDVEPDGAWPRGRKRKEKRKKNK